MRVGGHETPVGADIVVVGGGLVGLATAYHLVREGRRVVLVDRGDRGRATDAGAGILSPAVSGRGEALAAFAEAAAAYYPRLVDALRGEEAGETGYAAAPLLFVAADDTDLDAFTALKEMLTHARRVPGRAHPTEVSPGHARSFLPLLGRVAAALLVPDAARVDGRLLSAALRRVAERRGLAVRAGSVERLLVEGGRVRGVLVDGERLDADQVVAAGGAWSRALGEPLGLPLPVEPQRGQIAHLRLPESTDGWAMVMAMDDHYLVPWPDARVAAGATRETGSGFDPRPTAGGVHQVLSAALRLAPGLARAELLEVRVGLRPLCADGLPVIGPVPGVDGAFVATGHGPAGLLLGPYTGKVLAEVMLGRPPEVDLTPFRPDRFASSGRS